MRFIHTSDLNLSTKEEYKDSYEAFKTITERCRGERIDLLLISGDLFLGHPTVSDIKEFRLALSKLLTTQVVLLAGDHDFLNDRSRIYEVVDERRVHLLDDGADSTLLMPECGVVCYGASYNRRTQAPEKTAGIHTYRTRGLHIYMGHGELPNCDLSGFDYVAMGGSSEYRKEGNAIWPGKGTAGYVIGNITSEGLETEFVALEGFDIAGGEDEKPEESLLTEYNDLREKYDGLKAEFDRSTGLIKANESETEGSAKAGKVASYAGVIFVSVIVFAFLSNIVPGVGAAGASAALFILGALGIQSKDKDRKKAKLLEEANNVRLKEEMKELSDRLLEYEKNFDAMNYPEA